MDNILDEADLDAAPSDMLAFVHYLTNRLGRRPSYGEVIRARRQVFRSRAQQADAKALPPPRQKARKQEKPGDHVREIMGSPELLLAVSAAFAMLQVGVALAWQGGSFLRSAPYLPRPRSAQQALQERHEQVRELRRAEAERRYGDADYPRALKAIIRTDGKPKLPIRGRDPWEIVSGCRPGMAALLRKCSYEDWPTVRRHVWPQTSEQQLAGILAPAAAPTLPPLPQPAGRGFAPERGKKGGRNA